MGPDAVVLADGFVEIQPMIVDSDFHAAMVEGRDRRGRRSDMIYRHREFIPRYVFLIDFTRQTKECFFSTLF